VPTYSYRCANCGHEFDQYQAFTDNALSVCPDCGEPRLRKVFNSIGVTFNGSGFYRTDARAEGKSSAAASGNSSSSGSGSSGSGSSSTGESSSSSSSTTEKKTESSKPAAAAASAATSAP
jgi:putative FmdB family regulatory protein